MTSKYENYTKQELVQLLLKRDAERPLGLVWERDEIEYERSLNEDFVTLDLIEDLSVGNGTFKNLLIEGDNFDALRYLHMAYKGRIQCIYIDPPYNTGNKDFIYNDCFVDKDHSYKYSLWLEHLYQRLIIAKDLLTDDGVILVSINDENRSKLDLLLEKIMPGCRRGSLTWRTKDTGNDAGGNLSQVHEHVLVYANSKFEFKGNPIDVSKYRNPDDDFRGKWRPQPITCNKSLLERENLYYPIQNPKTGYWYPCDPDTVWRYSTESKVKDVQKLRSEPIEVLIEKEEIFFPECNPEEIMRWDTREELIAAIQAGEGPILPKKKTPLLREDLPDLDFWVGKEIAPGRPSRKHFLDEKEKLTAPLSSWIAGINEDVEFDIDFDDEIATIRSPRGREGSDQIKGILGNKAFDFPKPPTLIKNLVDQAAKPDSIVLDFYAGSGTTAQSVLALNNSENVNRRFIMVSATEATEKEPEKNVCRDVCSVRIKRVIEGYDKQGPLGGDFAYMKAVRTPMEYLHDDIQHDQIWYVLQQIHFDQLVAYDEAEVCQRATTQNTDVIYVPETNKPSMDYLAKVLSTTTGQVKLYTWRPAILRQEFNEANIDVERIPEFIVDRFGGGAS